MEDFNQTTAPKFGHTSHFSRLLLSRSVGQVTFESGLLFLINLTALTGNLLIISAVYRNRRLQTSTNVLLLALASTDLFFSSFCLPISLGVLMTGRWVYDQNTCWLQCLCVYFAAFSTLYIITLTALNRYVRVVKTRYFNKLFGSIKDVVVKVVTVWLGIGFILAMIFICRLARAEFNPAQSACVMFLNRETNPIILSTGTAFFIMVFFSILPTFLILFFNVRIFQAVKKHFTRVIPSLHAGNRNLDVNLAELKVTKTLFIVVTGFLLCWSPIMVVEILQGFFIDWWKLPRPVHMLWMYLGALSSALNPFIYGITNAGFRREFRAIICWFKKGTR